MNRELPQSARKEFERAVALFNEGRLATAEGICAELIARFPLDADIAHFGGVVANRMGRYDVAVQRLSDSVQAQPSRAKALAALGFAQEKLGHLEQARQAFDAAIKAEPSNPDAHNGLGVTLVRMGQSAAALGHFERAAALRPAMSEARLNAAHCLLDMGLTQRAAQHLRDAAALAANRDDVLSACAAGLLQADDFESAERILRTLLEKNPADATVQARLGLVLEARGLEAEALAIGEAAVRGTNSAFAHDAYGILLLNRKRHEEAAEEFRKALALDPGLGEAAVNLGVALSGAGHTEEARAQMLAAEPSLDALGLARLAANYSEIGDSDACIEACERALRKSANLQLAHATLAIELLRTNRTERGWQEYLYRPARGSNPLAHVISGTYPPKLPANLQGRDIVILAEQGLGDMLFFLRFAKPLAQAGARLHVKRLYSRLEQMVLRALPIDLWPDERPADPDTLVIWAGDLPLFVRPLTGSDTAESLRAEPLAERVERMRERLGPAKARRIGVAWRAGTVPSRTSGRKQFLYKDLQPKVLGECLAGLPFEAVSIQRNPEDGATRELEDAMGARVIDCSDVNGDLEDMLALLSLLDDYAGVSSTNIHLLGLLGRGGRVLVPFPPDWRWQARGQSLWHPESTAYRQSPERDWRAALRDLRTDLTMEAQG